MSLILAPYNDSMRLGQGFNSYTHELCIDRAVKLNPKNIKTSTSTAQVVSYSSRFVEKLSDVVDTMNISYSSSIKKGTVEISGNSSTIDETTFKASDLNAVVSVKVTNQTQSIEDDAQFVPIKDVYPGSAQFNRFYGDCYISGFVEGGDFTGILSIKALDRTNKNKVISNIKNAFGNSGSDEFTLDSFDTGSSASASMMGTESTIALSWIGGGQVKDANTKWDFESMYAAAAAFPARVAECPQRTWAILTKYKANRSFVEWTNSTKPLFKTLEYDQVASFTSELFDSFMDYKLLLKDLQSIINNRDHYKPKLLVTNAIDTDMATLLSVRAALRDEQTKIVKAIDVLSQDPGILNRQARWSETHRAPIVNKIIQEALGKWATADTTATATKKSTAGAGDLTALPPVSTSPSTAKCDDDGFTKVDPPAAVAAADPAPELDFNFETMIPAEVWEDLMPELKPEYAPTDAATATSLVPAPPPGLTPLGSGGFYVANPNPEPVQPDIVILKAKEMLEAELKEAQSAVADARADVVTIQKQLSDAEARTQSVQTELGRMRTEAADQNARATQALNAEKNSTDQLRGEVASIRDQYNAQIRRAEAAEATMLPTKPGNRVWISAAIWGRAFITEQTVLNRCYEAANDKREVCFDNNFFMHDGLPGMHKTGVVAYRYDNRGPMRYLIMTEGSKGRFDGW